MKKEIILLLLVLTTFPACSLADSEKSFFNAASGKDFKSPVLESVETIDMQTVSLAFNEEIIAYEDSFENCNVESDGRFLIAYLDNSLKAGKSYYVKGMVSDLSGNICSVSVKVWGYNHDPASLLINEFTTSGTTASPDRTELYVYSSGSLTGMCLYDGIPSDFRSCVIFEDIHVKSGSYVVIWWTENLPAGVSDHPSENVYNVCAHSKTNLSENNGILTLALSPAEGASVIDCIAYSSFESKEYGGFGTKEVLTRVTEAQNRGFLKTETVSSKNSRATRSISRRSDGSWYVTESSGSTFGAEN